MTLSRTDLESLHNKDASEYWWLYRNLNSKDAGQIAELLPSATITSLNLNGNQIGDDGVVEISSKLQGSSLVKLNLAGNGIGDIGCEHLAKSLEHTQLEHLCLLGNEITTVGARAIATLLYKNNYITELFLYLNQIGDEGMEAIAQAIARHKYIQSIWLDHNPITLKGLHRSLVALKGNTSVTMFEITIGDEQMCRGDREFVKAWTTRNLMIQTKRDMVGTDILLFSRMLALVDLPLPHELVQMILVSRVDCFDAIEKAILARLLDRNSIGKVSQGIYSGARLILNCMRLNI